jgi:hypothetical protein
MRLRALSALLLALALPHGSATAPAAKWQRDPHPLLHNFDTTKRLLSRDKDVPPAIDDNNATCRRDVLIPLRSSPCSRAGTPSSTLRVV